MEINDQSKPKIDLEEVLEDLLDLAAFTLDIVVLLLLELPTLDLELLLDLLLLAEEIFELAARLLLVLTPLLEELDLLPLADEILLTELLVILEFVVLTLPLLLFATVPFKASLLTEVTEVDLSLPLRVYCLPFAA